MTDEVSDKERDSEAPELRPTEVSGSAASTAWERVLEAGIKAQRLVPGAIAVGGTAAALYAAHRISQDTDHLVFGLRDRFDDVLGSLNASPLWKTARTNRPVLILGSIDGVEVGFREPRRQTPIKTVAAATSRGALLVPTLDEMLGMKAWLAYSRNALRDYLDFAALSTRSTDERTLAALLELDEQYAGVQTSSVRLEVAKALAASLPFDLEQVDLSCYKGLAPEWRDWRHTEAICRRLGLLLAERIIGGGSA
jgi:hypothetical protein